MNSREVFGGDTDSKRSKSELSTRTDFLRSITTAGTAFLTVVGVDPSMAVAAKSQRPQDPADKLQAGFDSFNKQATKMDRVVTKQTKKMNRVVTKETNKVSRAVRNDMKKVDRVVQRETKKVMRKADKETKGVQLKAKKIGSAAEQKTRAFVGNLVPPQAAAGGASKLSGATNIGIDVSKVKVCSDLSNKCL
jgi:hypothetical protein